eukprot:gene21066-25883_t
MSKWEDVDCSWAPPIIEELVGPRGYGKCAVLVKRPAKEITNDCFEIQTRPVPDTLAEGDVLVQQLLLSMDPTHSMWMRKITQYSPCVAIGNVMRCSGVGRVVKSSDESRLAVGAYVTTFAGLSEYLVMKIEQCTPVAKD